MMRKTGLLCFAFVLVSTLAVGMIGCGGSAIDPDAQQTDHDQRFVGSWTLKTGSGILQMERWDLRADGTATLTASNLDAPIEVTGKSTVSCSFGDRWSSAGPNVLNITLRCNDAVVRNGAIEFPTNVSQNLVGSEIQIVSVNGERDWQPRGGQLTLSMVRCAAAGGGC